MTTDIKISYGYEGINVTLTVPADYDSAQNLPYALATAFERVIIDTNANPDIVVEQLTETFKQTEEEL